MKKNLTLLAFILLASKLICQDVWAPEGATWYYDYSNFWNQGYVKIMNVGDSLIDNQTCQVLEKKRYWYDYVQLEEDSVLLGHEFTYLDSGIVYYYRHNQFFKLYDFNAIESESWEVAGWNDFVTDEYCDSIGVVTVDSTDSFTHEMFTLNRMYINPTIDSDWGIYGQVIERIGAVNYMFPEIQCVFDLAEGGPLRCYSDNEFGLYQVSSNPCDFVVGVDDFQKITEDFSMYPNPALDHVIIDLEGAIEGEYMVEIRSSLGKVYQSIKTFQRKIEFELEDLSPGVYLITLIDPQNQKLTKRLIVTQD